MGSIGNRAFRGMEGYDSQGSPGVIALKRGLERLNYIIEGINLIKDVGTP